MLPLSVICFKMRQNEGTVLSRCRRCNRGEDDEEKQVNKEHAIATRMDDLDNVGFIHFYVNRAADAVGQDTLNKEKLVHRSC